MNKKPWQSKTLIVNLVVAAAAIAYPPAVVYIQAHPEAVAVAFSAVNILLRLWTKGGVSITDDASAAK